MFQRRKLSPVRIDETHCRCCASWRPLVAELHLGKIVRVTVIFAIALLYGTAPAAAAGRGSSIDELAAAKRFALGGTGIAGTMSEGERQLRAVLRRHNAAEQLKEGISRATLEGQLYMLVGLRRCDFAAYRQIFRTLPRPSADVEVMHGCIVGREPFRQVLSQIHGGLFDDFLSRPPW